MVAIGNPTYNVGVGKRVKLDGDGEWLMVEMTGNYFTLQNAETEQLFDGHIARHNLEVIL